MAGSLYTFCSSRHGLQNFKLLNTILSHDGELARVSSNQRTTRRGRRRAGEAPGYPDERMQLVHSRPTELSRLKKAVIVT